MLNLKGKKLILASKSPRRADLLKLIGLNFEIVESRVQEADERYTMPEVHVLELAQKKALKVAEKIGDGLVIGADTIVVLDGKTMGKPRDIAEARQMLHDLSGKTHTVYTGFAIVDKATGKMISDYEKTLVTFRLLEAEEIEAYVQTQNPMDKAGAYGIQDQSAVFAQKIDGCFYNVVGFPLTKFYVTLREFCKQNQELF
jgi:septum formation protein